MIALFALSLLAAAPATAPETLPARFKKTTAFTAWLGTRVVLQEEWLELPESGLQVGYFLAPKADTPKNGEPPFEDAFFAVDARTGAAVTAPLVRTALPLNGCPGPGDVSTLGVGESQKGAASVHFGAPSQQCLVLLRRTSEGAWSATGFPDPARPADANFPKAAHALTNDPKFPKDQVLALTWSYLSGSSWLIASSKKECRFWAVNSASAEVSWDASEVLTSRICGCAEQVLGAEPVDGADMAPVARSVIWVGGGSSVPTCECVFSESGTVNVECETRASQSPAIAAMLEEENPELYENSHEGRRLIAIEAGLLAARDLLAANQVALDAWEAGQEDEALKAWLKLYRQYVAAGRPAEEDAFGELAERIVVLRYEPTDFRHASIDLWAESLNNLGFALWSRKELKQADAVYEECQRLLSRTRRERNVLNLNRGDLYRDLGQVERAIEAYQRFLSGTVAPGQRKRVEAELRKLQKSAP